MSWERKDKIKFYCFYYNGIVKPVIIEARNKEEARKTLKSIRPTLPAHYLESHVVGESVKSPVYGVSEKNINGVKYIWVGEKYSQNGWIEFSKFPK